jgi:hypothetical protein
MPFGIFPGLIALIVNTVLFVVVSLLFPGLILRLSMTYWQTELRRKAIAMRPETKHGSVEDKPRDDTRRIQSRQNGETGTDRVTKDTVRIIIESLHNPIADA